MSDKEQSGFKLDLQAVLDRVKSLANIKKDIKYLESKLKIKLQGTLNKTATKKELNANLKSIKPKIKVDADITEATKKIKKLGENKNSKITIRPTVDNSQVVSGLKEAQKQTKTLWERFVSGAVGANLVRMSVQKVTQAIYQAIAGIKELDKIKTDIQTASGVGDSEVNSMMQTYNQMAKDLSSTTKDVGNAANEIVRMGESLSNTNKLIENSTMLAKIGMIDSSQATEYLISSMKGFQVSAEDSMKIIDKLTSVDMQAAVSAGGLAEAMSRTANIANNSGTSMDRLIGYMATVGEVTQDSMSVIGNAFKSMYSRMNNIKVGKFVDEQTGESLSDTEAVLNKLGIQLRDTQNTYRDFDDVLDDVGNNWKNFNQVEQNAISVAIAGTMQRERFIALMNNYANALNYSEVAANSAGSALERYGVYQDSIEAKTNELTAAIEYLSMNIVSEGLYSGIVEATTGIVEFLDKTNLLKGALAGVIAMGVSKAFVSMATGIISAAKSTAQLSAAMALFDKGRSKQNLLDIGAACKGLSNQQLKLILSTKGLIDEDRKKILTGMGVAEAEHQQTLATLGFASAENAATVSTFSFKGALTALWTTILANPIGAIVAAVSAITIIFSKYKQEQEEMIQSARDAADAYNQSSDSIKDYTERYQELRKALIAAKGDEEETYNVKQQLLDLQTELNDKYGEEYGSLNLVTSAYRDQTEAIRKYNKELAYTYLNENEGGIRKATKKMEGKGQYNLSQDGVSAYTEEGEVLKELAEKYKEQGVYLVDRMGNGAFDKFSVRLEADPQSAYDTINAFESDLRDKAKELGDEHMFDDVLVTSSASLNEAKSVIEEYGEIYRTALLSQIAIDNKLSSGYNKAVEAVEAYNEAVLKSDSIYNDGDVAKAYEELQSVRKDIENAEEWEKYSQVMDEVFASANDGLYAFYQAMQEDKSIAKLARELKGLSDLDLQAMADDGDNGDAFDKLCTSAEKYGLEVQDLIGLLTDLKYVQGEVQDAVQVDIPAPTFSSTLSQVESLSEGLDQLDKIYADICDKEEFDWSSILNNEGFSKVFSTFTDEYENFIQTISNNTSDIEACQDAFDRLATAYINNSDAMKNLTPETKEATIAMLEQMGVMNAEEVVTSRLAAQEAFLAAQKEISTIESENLTDATWQEIAAVLAEGNASETAANYLLQLAFSKIDINNNPINSDNDVNAIIAIAEAAGQSTEYVNALKMALVNLQNAQASVQNAKNSKFMGASKAFQVSFAESLENNAQNTVDDLLNDLKNGISDIRLNPADFYAKVNYGGGSATKDAIDKADKEKSGSKSKEAEKEEKETKETFNWIETAISRVQRLITKLKNTVSSTYKSWSTRNNALGNELHTITEELSHQQRAYEKYMGLANSVGLDGYYQHLVQIGDINLSEITDETLKEQIKQYKEYYEKALDAADAVEELKDSMAELAKVRFDNLSKQFEAQNNAIEQGAKTIDERANQIKEMGYMLNRAYYEQAADFTRKNISELQNEYSTLNYALKKAVDDKDIAEFSEEWYAMQSKISDVEQAIIQANTALIEYSNTLRELEWEKFDLMEDHISGITEETEFLIDLLSNDNLLRDKGVFSIFGEATLGLHSLSYESYLRQAKDYAQELEKIEASIANDKNNTKLLERREELLKLQRENILSAQAEKQAIRDLYEDSFKAMLSHLQELIDKRKEALKAEKDLYDYQKNVAKQTKEIASYQKQLDAYAGDTSEETKATIQKLKVSLEEAKQELKDTEYDKWISDQERLMDDLYNEYEILLNKRLDNIDGLMKEAISQTNANSKDILSTIIAASGEVGYTITDAMGTIWGMDGGIGKVLSDYSSTFVATMSNLQLSVDAIKNYILQIDQNRLPENKLEGDAVNGWRNENGAWSYYENNQRLSNTWVKDKGKYYHLNENGTMDANQWIWNDSGTWSYVDGGGAAMTGWQYLHWNGRDAWFNFDENGIMKANEWINDYFVDAYGYMRSNEWIGHNGKYYWVGADGKWLDLPGWSLDERPKDGLPIYEYAKGSNYIPSDRIAWTQENGKGEAIYRKSDGALLTPLGKGDAVFTPEKTERLLKMLRGDSYIPEQNLGIKSADYGTIQNIQNIQNTQNSQPVTNITFGDITLPDVLNSKQFVNSVEQVMRDAMCKNGLTKRCMMEAITAPMLGKGTLTAHRYRW